MLYICGHRLGNIQYNGIDHFIHRNYNLIELKYEYPLEPAFTEKTAKILKSVFQDTIAFIAWHLF